MKRIFLIILSSFLISGIYAMSLLKEDKEPDNIEMKTEPAAAFITASPVYLGNAPFERLALKIKNNAGQYEYFYIEFEKDSNITEKEISDLQGMEIQFFGRFEDNTFILSGYKNEKKLTDY